MRDEGNSPRRLLDLSGSEVDMEQQQPTRRSGPSPNEMIDFITQHSDKPRHSDHACNRSTILGRFL